jgi:hypothetical protein
LPELGEGSGGFGGGELLRFSVLFAGDFCKPIASLTLPATMILSF